MRGTVHLALGVTTGAIIGYTLCDNMSSAVMVSLGCAVGSIFPDIDSKTSMISRRFRVGSFIARLISSHRELFHTPFNIVLLWLVCSLMGLTFHIPIYLMIGFSIGNILHLLQDTCTKRGIRWLYPVNNRYFSLVHIKSGHFLIEMAISTCMAMMIFTICLLIKGFQLHFF